MRVISFIFLICFLFSISINAQTQTAETFFRQGTQAAEKQEFERALGSYKKALVFAESEDTSNTRAFLTKVHYNIGVCYYRLNLAEPAIAELTKAVTLSRGSYQKAFYALGMAEIELKNWEKSKTAFLSSLRLNERDGEAWFDLGMVLVWGKDYENARTAFAQAVKYNTISKSASFNNMGVIFALTGDFQSAEKEFKLALFESDGKLTVAERNLQFCRSRSQKAEQNENYLSKLEFSGKNNIGN